MPTKPIVNRTTDTGYYQAAKRSGGKQDPNQPKARAGVLRQSWQSRPERGHRYSHGNEGCIIGHGNNDFPPGHILLLYPFNIIIRPCLQSPNPTHLINTSQPGPDYYSTFS